MRNGNIISFAQLERARKVRLLKSGIRSKTVRKDGGVIVSRDLVSREAVSREHGTKEDSVIESDVVASGKIVSFVPRKSPQFSAQDSSNVPSRGQIPIAHEVQNVDIPDGPYYL